MLSLTAQHQQVKCCWGSIAPATWNFLVCRDANIDWPARQECSSGSYRRPRRHLQRLCRVCPADPALCQHQHDPPDPQDWETIACPALRHGQEQPNRYIFKLLYIMTLRSPVGLTRLQNISSSVVTSLTSKMYEGGFWNACILCSNISRLNLCQSKKQQMRYYGFISFWWMQKWAVHRYLFKSGKYSHIWGQTRHSSYFWDSTWPLTAASNCSKRLTVLNQYSGSASAQVIHLCPNVQDGQNILSSTVFMHQKNAFWCNSEYAAVLPLTSRSCSFVTNGLIKQRKWHANKTRNVFICE